MVLGPLVVPRTQYNHLDLGNSLSCQISHPYNADPHHTELFQVFYKLTRILASKIKVYLS